MKELAIQLRDIEFSFLIQRYGVGSLKEFLLKPGKGKYFAYKTVLRDINLDVFKGETFGLLGVNGSGKSTLLRIVAGILRPNRGSVHVFGRVAPLLALGVGLQPELSGLENIQLCGTLMGLSPEEIRRSRDQIIEFSELSDSVTMQVKRYSSGMLSRLSFAIATAIKPEILIIDEVLSVGDLGFQKKCARWIEDIRQQGCTILYVSHSPGQVRKMCTRAACLEDGRISIVDDAKVACDYYLAKFGG
ncbi:MAG: ABC transporter ATP-binding protein [Cyanobacteria bacterium J06626_14]